MQPIHRAVNEKRMVAGIAAAMMALLGCSAALVREERSAEPQAKEQPFWFNEVSASNLAVVELQRSGAASWGQQQ